MVIQHLGNATGWLRFSYMQISQIIELPVQMSRVLIIFLVKILWRLRISEFSVFKLVVITQNKIEFSVFSIYFSS